MTAGRVLVGTARIGGRAVGAGARRLPGIEPGGWGKILRVLLGVGGWLWLLGRWPLPVTATTAVTVVGVTWAAVDRRVRRRYHRWRTNGQLDHNEALGHITLLEHVIMLLLRIIVTEIRNPAVLDEQLRVREQGQQGWYRQAAVKARRMLYRAAADPDVDPGFEFYVSGVARAEQVRQAVQLVDDDRAWPLGVEAG